MTWDGPERREGYAEFARAIGGLEATVEALEKSVTQLQADVRELKAQANKWRGGLGVVLALGGIAGATATVIFGWLLNK